MIVGFQSPSQEENLSPHGLAALIKQAQNSGEDAKYSIAPTPSMIASFNNPIQEENFSPHGRAALIKQAQNSGDDAKYLIAPTHIEQSCTARRKSPSKKQPKNHLKANRKALKEKQRNNKDESLERNAQERVRLQQIKQKKQKLYGTVRSKVFDPAASLSSPSDRDCPSAAALRSDGASVASPFTTADSPSNEQACRIAFGRKVPISAPAPRPSSVASSSSKHKSYGKVPSYLLERRAKIEREEEEQRRLQANAPPVPGLVLMEESQRLETLSLLAENEREAREKLVNIPFSMNEQRAARLREAIEFRLKEIEDTRKIFSKDRVFVAEE